MFSGSGFFGVDVAPYAGAWIEILSASIQSGISSGSLPTRERGLKSFMDGLPDGTGFVAPYAGAWIEIFLPVRHFRPLPVAPYAGAWIEIVPSRQAGREDRSLPTRERGLKYQICVYRYVPYASLPTRERGLKLFSIAYPFSRKASLPTRERGLKWTIW